MRGPVIETYSAYESAQSEVEGEPALLCFVVDDEAGLRSMVATVLRRMGCDVAEFADVASLVQALEGRHPSLIFLDITMGNSDAVDAIRGLCDHNYGGAVQLVSGRDDETLAQIHAVGSRRGIRMLPPVAKPFRIEQIRGIVAAHAAPGADGAFRAAAQSGPAVSTLVSLEQALAQDWVTFWYQPKIDLATRSIVGAEALARVDHPDLGILTPAAFLPRAAERDFDELTRRAVLAALRDWDGFAQLRSDFRISVNASAGTLARLPISSLVRSARPQNPLWPGLIVELTEDEVTRDIDIVQEVAAQLSLYGVTLSIDDFGAGYSSFSRMKQVPFKEVKLDGSYVEGCAHDPVNAGLCRTMIEMAHGFGSTVVAERVESEEDCRALQAMGCDLGQGYLFGRPVPKRDLVAQFAGRSPSPLQE